MKYYRATFASGRSETRCTANRTYTHAILGWQENGRSRQASWAGSPDLANARQHDLRNAGWPEVEIAPAVEIDAAQYRAIKAAALDARTAALAAHAAKESLP